MTNNNVTIVKSWSLEEGAKRVSELFTRTFNCEPDGVWHAPGRVNLIGEHVDYNGGICLPIALPHRTFAAVKAHDNKDRLLRLVSAQRDGVTTINLDNVGPHDSDKKVEGWGAYVSGVLWSLEQEGYGPFPGYDIAIDSCVPFGAGLSSSAALECSVAVAIDDLAGLELAHTREGLDTLVKTCIRAENEIAGANTGGLDQSSSLKCKEGMAIRLDCQDGSVSPVPFDLDGHNLALLVIDTKAPHSLNDGQYANRRASCESAAHNLGVALLADVKDIDSALARLNDETEKKRARHVLTEIQRTQEAIALLQEGELTGERLDKVGKLFDESHDSLRDDYQVTCPELDVAVDVARQHGSHGARMTGGGFGGSAIAVVDKDKAEEIMQAIVESYKEHGFHQPEFLLVTPAIPAGKVC